MSRPFRIIRTVAVSLFALIVLLAVVAWLSGWFEPKLAPGWVERIGQPVTGSIVQVEEREVPLFIRVTGTVRAVQETAVGSRLLAPVEAVPVVAGQAVTKGDVLVRLDDAELQARQRQTQAELQASLARLAKAQQDLSRIEQVQARGAATEQELYNAKRGLDVAQAESDAATSLLAVIETQLAYAIVRSPFDAIVIEKRVEAGDLVRPGDSLVSLYDPTRLQLVAPIPERLAVNLKLGQRVGVEIEALHLRCEGQVSEIVPQASPGSRSLLVKVTGPCPPGVLSGMFGRLLIPEGTRRQRLIPKTAVRRVGQLDMVMVVTEARDRQDRAVEVALQRYVRTAAADDDQVEVLSGLEPGERVVAVFAATPGSSSASH